MKNHNFLQKSTIVLSCHEAKYQPIADILKARLTDPALNLFPAKDRPKDVRTICDNAIHIHPNQTFHCILGVWRPRENPNIHLVCFFDKFGCNLLVVMCPILTASGFYCPRYASFEIINVQTGRPWRRTWLARFYRV